MRIHYEKGTDWRFRLASPLFALGSVDVGAARYLYGDEDGECWLIIGPGRMIFIPAGYAWDGSSPKFRARGRWWGTPDTEGNTRASCVHDALYQFLHVPGFPYTRKQADQLFLDILRSDGFRGAWLYHAAVRLFGGLFRLLPGTDRSGRQLEETTPRAVA